MSTKTEKLRPGEAESAGRTDTVTQPSADRFTRRSFTFRRPTQWQNWALTAVAVVFAVIAIAWLAA